MTNLTIKKAIEILGNQASLAAAVTEIQPAHRVSQQAVSGWLRNGCPPDRVLAVEKATNGEVTRYQLRPDIYPLDEGAVA